MGCYPIFSCQNWSRVTEDIRSLSEELVTISLVADPFGDYRPEDLSLWFDQVVTFKHHRVVDFSKPLSVTKHHSYYGRKARAELVVEIGAPTNDFADEWTAIYSCLVNRHNLKGIKAFSRASFEIQLKIPGMVVARALKNGVLVGAHLWYEQQGIAYSHLAASTDAGYALNCSYAIYAAALEYFQPKMQFINLGAGAGLNAKDDKLDWFKAGWSNALRTAYFCGRVLNAPKYRALTNSLRTRESTYFPAYRSGEMI